MNEVDRIKKGDFSDKLFNSLKLELERRNKLSLEEIDSRSQLMMDVFSQGKSWEDYLQEVKDIESLRKQDIIDVANKYFTGNYLEINKKTGNYPKDNLQKPGFAPIIPKNGEAKSEYAKNMEKMPVKNANPRFLDFDKDAAIEPLTSMVTLYSTTNPVNDIFSLDIEYGKGTLESKLISPMTTYISLLGSDSLSFDQFKGKLQNIGSTISFNSHLDKFVIEITGFDRNFDSTMVIVGDFLKNVKADKKKMKQVVNEKRVGEKAEKESSDNVGEALLDKVRYGDKSDYLNRLSLSELKKIKGEDLVAEFKSVTKVECSMHYCGKLSISEVSSKIKKHLDLGGITIASATPLYRQLKPVDVPVVYLVDIPKSAQSIIYGYAPGGVNPDLTSQYAGALFNNYFGGSMGSLVFQQIREFRSLAYRARAKYNMPDYKHRDMEGQFIASLSTQCDKTIDAIGVLDSLIKMMPAKPERVETARQDAINNAYNDYPALRYRSSQIAGLKKQGYTSDPKKQLVEAVSTMGIDEIVSFYNKNVKNNKISYLIVGDVKKIDMARLAKYGNIVRLKKDELFK